MNLKQTNWIAGKKRNSMQKNSNVLKILRKKVSKSVELLMLYVKTSKQTIYDMCMSQALAVDFIELLSTDVCCGKRLCISRRDLNIVSDWNSVSSFPENAFDWVVCLVH